MIISFIFFFFKQKTAYEVRISDWSSDVCSSDLEEKITNYAREYCETMRPRGECEFMGDFAFEFPIKVFLELMGFPIALAPTFLEWEMGLLHTNDLGVIAQSTRKEIGRAHV